MNNISLTSESLAFLKQLEKNNNRDWFAEHKVKFKEHEAGFKEFMNILRGQLSIHDEIEKTKIFRIYRDVRFSKNKTPYKTNFAGSFTRSGAKLRGGYYVHIQPSKSFIATGFWQPNKEDLLRIRKELETDAFEFKKVISDKQLKNQWGNLMGDELKTAPKGFDKEHSAIELIRKKQYIFTKSFSDDEVVSEDFMSQINIAFQSIRPFFDLMSDILTTNLNGESLL
ncbi:TIGR02453 family protein [Kriegella sp. EG-1]|nr:TIGR02453 family protein [Flavobacteriaceae bacterium EG-1]